jgi:hypothetical protein
MGSLQAPAALDDPIRGKEYFDRTALLPPGMERYWHSEAGTSHIISDNTEVVAAVFRDRIYTQTLLVSTPDGRRSLLILDTSQSPSTGIRVHLNRRMKAFEAGVGYTAATGLAIAAPADTMDNVKTVMVPRRFQVVTARLKTDVSVTRTEVVAVYRWMSSFSASDVDPYQNTVEFNDPTLSLTIAQDLPVSGLFRGKVQAILDARNLFDHSFDPNAVQVAQYPRLLKGGINIKF